MTTKCVNIDQMSIKWVLNESTVIKWLLNALILIKWALDESKMNQTQGLARGPH